MTLGRGAAALDDGVARGPCAPATRGRRRACRTPDPRACPNLAAPRERSHRGARPDASRKRPLLRPQGRLALRLRVAFIVDARRDATHGLLPAATLEAGGTPASSRGAGHPRVRRRRQRRSNALVVAVAAAQALSTSVSRAQLNLAGGDLPARAPKSNARQSRSGRPPDVREHGNARPPRCSAHRPHGSAKARGHEGYAYPHDDPAGFDVSYLPEELRGRRYYRPSGTGEELVDGGDDR